MAVAVSLFPPPPLLSLFPPPPPLSLSLSPFLFFSLLLFLSFSSRAHLRSALGPRATWRASRCPLRELPGPTF